MNIKPETEYYCDEHYKRIVRMTGLDHSEIEFVCPYGSRVYGTNSYNSDYDYIVVFKGDKKQLDAQQFDSPSKDLSVHTYHMDSWEEHTKNHKIFVMECYSAMTQGPYTIPEPWKVDLPTLRKEISSKASNSWVKCKKKLEVENDYYTGIKSLFHSFRIPMFGIQMAENGLITDFSAANHWWFDHFEPMLVTRPTWSEIKEIYQPLHNQLMTDFRKLAAKE